MKERLPLAVTVLIVSIVLVVVIAKRPERRAQATPDETITEMLQASREGNARAYLECFAGRLRETTERSATDLGREGFRQYLQEQGRAVKGYAVTEREERGAKARLRVEFVYEDRHEAQWVTLERERGRWRIARLTPTERVEPAVKYGTPVTPLPGPGEGQEPAGE